jgi:hypothetical protein
MPVTWDQVRAFRLERHRLSDHVTPSEPLEALVRDVGGIHAQLMSAAELSVKVRSRRNGVSADHVRAGLRQHRTLFKTWAMRGTLHLLPSDDVAVYVAALRPRAQGFRPSWLSYFEVTAEEMETLVEAVRTALDGRCLTRAALADEVARLTGSPSLGEHLRRGWGSLLKPAAYRGILCFGPSQGQNVTFVRVDQWLAAYPTLDSADALREMLRRYLSSFGPATRQDFARWWWGGIEGLARPVWQAALADGELVEVEIENRVKAWALRTDLDRLQAVDPADSSQVRLLPHFDAYVMGFRPRDRLVAPALAGRVFRPQAWISPVVLVGGRVVGVWEQRRGTAQVELFEELSTAQQRALETEAGRLGLELAERRS